MVGFRLTKFAEAALSREFICYRKQVADNTRLK